MTISRRIATVVATVGLAVLAAGCAGSPQAGDQPAPKTTTKAPSTTATARQTPPTSSVPAKPAPQSRFESRPQVKVVRQWAVAYANAVNAKDRSLRALRPYSTAAGMRVFPQAGAEDYGTYFPGPQPITPTRVTATGARSVVTGCLLSDGWGQNRKTGKPASKHNVVPVDVILKKRKGHWKVDQLYDGSNNCAHVKVPGFEW
jgi:hypothetical protein